MPPCALPQVWANSKQSVFFNHHELYYRNKAIIHATLCTAAGVGKLKAEGTGCQQLSAAHCLRSPRAVAAGHPGACV